MSTPPVGAAFLLTQLGSFAAGRYAESVAGLELTPALTGIVRLLAVQPGITQQQLARLLGSAPSRVVAWIDDLEQRGWVERSRDPADRRSNALGLTAAGRRALKDIGGVARAHEERITAPLDADERDQLVGLLTKLANAHGLAEGVHPGHRNA